MVYLTIWSLFESLREFCCSFNCHIKEEIKLAFIKENFNAIRTIVSHLINNRWLESRAGFLWRNKLPWTDKKKHRQGLLHKDSNPFYWISTRPDSFIKTEGHKDVQIRRVDLDSWKERQLYYTFFIWNTCFHLPRGYTCDTTESYIFEDVFVYGFAKTGAGGLFFHYPK